MKNDVFQALEHELGPKLRHDEPLSRYTSWKVGGPADWLYRADTVEELCQAVAVADRLGLPVRILGGGSNVLVSDAGVRGLVVLNRARGYRLETSAESELVLIAEAGASLPFLAGQLAREGVAGLEWAVGIPGTVGGAVVQNAGAWGSEIKDRLLWVEVLVRGSQGGTIQRLHPDELDLRYRHSALRALSPSQRPVVLRAALRMDRDEPGAVQSRLAEHTARRTGSQPRAASGGSTFTNPHGDYAGRLIEAAGLKGRRVGGAEISRQHANFIVTEPNATADDIRSLIELAQREVERQFGVRLEPETEFIDD